MTDRSIRATGLIALALSLVLSLYSLGLAGHARRAIDAAAARQALLNAVQDRQDREIAELKALLGRLEEAERERVRRARGAPWRGRID